MDAAPVADQKVEIKITQITGDKKKLTSTIQGLAMLRTIS